MYLYQKIDVITGMPVHSTAARTDRPFVVGSSMPKSKTRLIKVTSLFEPNSMVGDGHFDTLI